MNTMTAYCNSPNPSILRETDGLGNCILLRAEIARLKNQVTDYLAVNAELVEKVESRDEKIAELRSDITGYRRTVVSQKKIIARLKEDGERLAASLNSTYKDGEFCCDGCGKWIKGDFVEWLTGTYDTGLLDAQHAPDCPITLHRALMKELEEK